MARALSGAPSRATPGGCGLTPLRALFLAAGVALFAWVASHADLASVGELLQRIGPLAFVTILLVYAVDFLLDVGAWQATLDLPGPRSRWLLRLFLVRIAGDAVNDITPAAGFGGEPVKAILLKRHHGVSYQESAAAVLLYTTVSCIALVVFLAAGFALVLGDPRFTITFKTLAAAGLAALTVGIAGFFAVQRFHLTSRLGTWVARWRPARRLAGVLHHVEAFERRLVDYYARSPRRFLACFALSAGGWLMGVVGVWVTVRFLGHPMSLLDAFVVETLAQLVRAGTFFIPASIGAQEGAFVVVFEALTGQGALGLAAALVRRGRELAWIALGLAVGWGFSLARGSADDARRRR